MKILRSVSQRGFSVGTAGWFTVLRPNTWFPASGLPRAAGGFGRPTKGAAEPAQERSAAGGVLSPAKAVQWAALEGSVENRHRIRSASAVLGALAITSAMLWWIMHP